jgi:hypothetical protein
LRVAGEDRYRAVGRVRLADAARIEAVHQGEGGVAEMGRRGDRVGGVSSAEEGDADQRDRTHGGGRRRENRALASVNRSPEFHTRAVAIFLVVNIPLSL